jgi:hypothetical protein
LNVWKFDISNLTLRKKSAISISSDKFSKTWQKLSNKIDPFACNQQEVVAEITWKSKLLIIATGNKKFYLAALQKLDKQTNCKLIL